MAVGGGIARRVAALSSAAAVAALLASVPGPAAATDLPAHPDQLKFPPLDYKPPRAQDYRVKLADGMVAYLVPDRDQPLVNIVVLMRVGPDLDPPGKEGAAATMVHLLTRGGTQTRTAEQIEDRVASLGAQVESQVGGGGGGFLGFGVPITGSESFVSINLLAKDLDEGLALLVDCLKNPAFQEDRFKLRNDQLMQSMKQRNDESAGIEEREWGFLARGDDHWSNRQITEASVKGVTRADLAALHKRYVGPHNFVFAISGNFDRATIGKKVEKAFAGWPTPGEHPAAPPAPSAGPRLGWFIVDKDVNQGRVSIGMPGLDRYDRDYQAARVMNDVLGGGGFTSHLVNRIRSDEGLAYSVGSRLEGGVYYPEPVRIAFQSKVRSVAFATQIALEEVRRMRDTPVTAEELELTKNRFIEGLPAQFASASAIAGALAAEEITGRYARDPDYYTQYAARVRAVTANDVARVAHRLLDPAKLTVLMVGNASDILLGDPKHDAQVAKLAGSEPTRLPMRDPMTMKPVQNP
jgi:predicted Zn-dependent peptidase